MTFRCMLSRCSPIFALATVGLAIAGIQQNWCEKGAAWYVAEDLRTLRANYCGPYHAAYMAWQSENVGRPVVPLAQQRLQCVDELTAKLAECIQRAGEAAQGKAASRPANLIAQYEKLLAPVGELGVLPPKELQIVQSYFQAYARASAEFLQSQGRMAAASGAPLEPLAEACFVLPLLTRPENAWDDYSLPPWLQQRTCRNTMEYLALRAGYPHAAYCCSRELPEPPTAQEFIDYAGSRAERLVTGRHFAAAEKCLRLGIEEARHSNLTGGIPGMEVTLVATLRKTNRTDEALCQARAALEEFGDTESFPNLVLVEMSVLYDTKKFAHLMEEVQQYKEDPRFVSVLPQLLHLAWAASRNDTATDGNAAEFWRAEFQKKFPKHALGAEMHLAAAMDALSTGDIQEASIVLECIRRDYPHSATAARAAALQQRMPPQPGASKLKR